MPRSWPRFPAWARPALHRDRARPRAALVRGLRPRRPRERGAGDAGQRLPAGLGREADHGHRGPPARGARQARPRRAHPALRARLPGEAVADLRPPAPRPSIRDPELVAGGVPQHAAVQLDHGIAGAVQGRRAASSSPATRTQYTSLGFTLLGAAIEGAGRRAVHGPAPRVRVPARGDGVRARRQRVRDRPHRARGYFRHGDGALANAPSPTPATASPAAGSWPTRRTWPASPPRCSAASS